MYLDYPLERVRLALLRQRRVPARFSLGDSHSLFTFAGIPQMFRMHIGPVTMHRVGRGGLGRFLLFGRRFTLWRRCVLRAGDSVFFCFGEIDCRCHIARQVAAGRREEEVIETLAERYVQALLSARRDGVTFWIVSVTPPVYAELLAIFRSFLPEGSDVDRARYTLTLNRALQKRAERHGFPYLDVYKLYRDAHGMLSPALSDGATHIGDTTRVRELLDRLSAGHGG